MTARAGRSAGSAGRDLALVGAAALLVALAYSLVYAWRGYTVPVGLDTPVYLWSGRYAAEFGLDAAGLLGRPGAFGAVATLLGLLPADDLTVTATMPIAVIVVSSLAAAAFLNGFHAEHRWTVATATLLVGLFLTPLTDGFLASSMFLACFVAGLAVLTNPVDITWRPTLLGAALLGAGGLSHPLFATIGLPIVATMAGASVLRRRSLPALRPVVRRIVVATAIAAVLTVVGVVALAPGTIPLDTSYDGALKRLGAVARTVIFRRHALEAELPAFLFLCLAGLIALDRLPSRPASDRVGRTLFWAACAGWVAVTAAAVAALAIGQPVPAHRLVWICLPPVLVVAAATSKRLGPDPSRPDGAWPRVVRLAIPIAVVAILASGHALRIRGIRPTVTASEAAFLGRFGGGLERSSAGTGAILLAGDLVLIPDMIDELNWLRASTAPDRLHDVTVFPGDPATFYEGGPEPFGDRAYDLVVADYAARVRSTVEESSVLVAAAPIDAEAAAGARDVDGSRPFGSDATLLPARAGGSAAEVASAFTRPPMAPWSVTLWTPILIAILGLIGIGWVRWSSPGRSLIGTVALAPAVGLAMLILASVLVDVVGIRLGAGGWTAATVIALVPGAVLGLVAARTGGPEREGEMTT